jgi:signal transduction histidine kinase
MIQLLDGELMRTAAVVGVEGDKAMGRPVYALEDSPLLRRVLEDQQPILMDDLRGDDRRDQIPVAEPLRSALCIPLCVKDDAMGILIVGSRSPARFSQQHVSIAVAVASQAAVGLHNARLFQQLRALASHLQVAREEERTNIAREIHDEFGQALTALKMDLAWLGHRLLKEQTDLQTKMDAMSSLLDTTIQNVRRVATELRPGLLDQLGLTAAIEWQAQEFTERTGIEHELSLGDEDIQLQLDIATAIFRIFQETLTNVVRHSRATHIAVELRDTPDEVVLIVRDNGKGISPSRVVDPQSLGLIGMRERARTWGGAVTVEGIPGGGTNVVVRIPRPKTEGGKND